jgi:ribosomal protein L11 methylase PrmA
MPYRIDIDAPPRGAAERLIDLGALDVDDAGASVAAILPDTVSRAAVTAALGVRSLRVTAAKPRDDGSVWALAQKPVTVGSAVVLLHESDAFGTGTHATTALCLDAIQGLCAAAPPARMLDVGTGTGILALAALKLGVASATGTDIATQALEAAAANAALNGLANRLELIAGGPEAVDGAWPLVVANIRAAELMEPAPALVRRLAGAGHLVLSGIPHGVAADVSRVYARLGLTQVSGEDRGGWSALVFRPSW